MIKRRRIADAKVGDKGIFIGKPFEGKWGLSSYSSENYLGEVVKAYSGRVGLVPDAEYGVVDINQWQYWYSWDDIKQYLSEEFVYSPGGVP